MDKTPAELHWVAAAGSGQKLWESFKVSTHTATAYHTYLLCGQI